MQKMLMVDEAEHNLMVKTANKIEHIEGYEAEAQAMQFGLNNILTNSNKRTDKIKVLLNKAEDDMTAVGGLEAIATIKQMLGVEDE